MTAPTTGENRKILGFYTAFTVVVANMVGTGVFTALGLQLGGVHDGLALLSLWLLGGVIALCGALSYGELAAALPRSGGEYHYLGSVYHPVLGIVAGWISVTVGFCAPIALAAMALGQYAATFLPVTPRVTAIVTILLVTAFHAFNVRVGQRFHVTTTVLKIALIVVFCIAGLAAPTQGDVRYGPLAVTIDNILSPAFAVSLIYVAYAFSGWNAAIYIAGEVRTPQRVVPRALVYGTLVVTLFYVLLNFVFLKTVPIENLRNTIEIGSLSARNIFGATGGTLMSVMLCLLLVSTISAMVFAGPRVLQVIGEDLPSLRGLAARTAGGAPLRAIFAQQALALGLVASGSFEGVLSYAGFTLTLIALLTVLGVIILRFNAPDLPRPYRAWGYPVTPALFVLLNAVILYFVLRERPFEAGAGILTLIAGLAIGLARHWRGEQTTD
ncbi:MAG: amino acid permease [Gammaproteobacteria bacterium]|jgi:APA family basic amino acid/polyamine antiporter